MVRCLTLATSLPCSPSTPTRAVGRACRRGGNIVPIFSMPRKKPSCSTSCRRCRSTPPATRLHREAEGRALRHRLRLRSKSPLERAAFAGRAAGLAQSGGGVDRAAAGGAGGRISARRAPWLAPRRARFETVFGVSLVGPARMRFRRYPLVRPRKEDVLSLELAPAWLLDEPRRPAHPNEKSVRATDPHFVACGGRALCRVEGIGRRLLPRRRELARRGDSMALRAPSGFGADDILEIRQLTGAGHLPPEILRLITEAAPTWSASA